MCLFYTQDKGGQYLYWPRNASVADWFSTRLLSVEKLVRFQPEARLHPVTIGGKIDPQEVIMPAQPCQEDGRPGYRWGSQGTCYTYTSGDDSSRESARARAERQGRAARASGYEGMYKWENESKYNELDGDERVLANAIFGVVEEVGPLDEAEGVWVGYKSAEENESSEIGAMCGNCVYFVSENECAILSREIEPEATCRFSIIPPGYVEERGDEEMSLWKGSFL